MTREQMLELAGRLDYYGAHQIGDTFRACRDAAAALRQMAEQQPVAFKFPMMLRKMWNGDEVQKWLNALPPLYAAPVPAVDAAAICEKFGDWARDFYKGRAENQTRGTAYNPYHDGFADGAYACMQMIRQAEFKPWPEAVKSSQPEQS
jgi:hypothetical protein